MIREGRSSLSTRGRACGGMSDERETDVCKCEEEEDVRSDVGLDD